MVKLLTALQKMTPARVMVVGDFMLDVYTLGRVKRISPEAPVMILQVESEQKRLGGAGNVVLNLQALGCQVIPVGRIGKDAAGQEIQNLLAQSACTTDGFVVQEEFQTPVKNRLLAQNQQIVRVDFEKKDLMPPPLVESMLQHMEALLDEVDAIAVSDYGKGLFSRFLLNALMQMAQLRQIPVIVDPKDRDFTKYAGATVVKPNLSECFGAVGVSPEATLDEAAYKVLQDSGAQYVVVTRSQEGIAVFSQDKRREDFGVRVREVKDVTGAGDTVLATITAALASGLTISEAAQLSNIAAGIAIEHVGCVAVSLEEIANSLENSSEVLQAEQCQ